MRVLVVSDTHHDRAALDRAIVQQPSAEVVVHLGDGEQEALEAQRAFPEKQFYMVRGNCDWGSRLPAHRLLTLAGKKLLLTHGYAENVKYGLSEAVRLAQERGADILLFGHTHEALMDYENGLYILNPGSLHGWGGTYGFVDLTEAGIATNIVPIR
ncbi:MULTISPECIES: metallophosphoesterase [Caproicibacterium]|uniref:Phosphoesterase n=1 Tax=Caproicibacterium argilliputei TaxID=3030016 RepID=A0AA97D8J7_9FIRM|nr:metallophosphoesterase [Caproicibacterium argilliputei]WOC32216.1 metallophosphoesterase [Caproicibacterium argilliputei]